jgi:uncharacterized protein (DUF1697 family)
MPKYIAFLRAINVKPRLVKMDVLRGYFRELDLTHVETYIQSGNVIFDTSARSVSPLTTRIEAHLLARLGYEVATFLQTPEQLALIAAYDPFARLEQMPEDRTYITFLRAEPTADAQRALIARQTPTEVYHFRGSVLYTRVHGSTHGSKFSHTVLERVLAMPTTTRNQRVVQALAEKYPGSQR